MSGESPGARRRSNTTRNIPSIWATVSRENSQSPRRVLFGAPHQVDAAQSAAMVIVPGAVGLRRDLFQDDPADPVQDELELVGQDRPQLGSRALGHAVEVEAAGRQGEVAGV